MKRTLFAATAFAVVAGTAPLAFATSTASNVIVVPDDFNRTLSDTRPAGHYAVVGSGLHLWTEGSTHDDKVAEYVNNSTALADVGEPTLDYTNTTGGGVPGAQLVVDFNHDGTADGILVGESVYSPDWWLNNAAQQFVKDGAPSHAGGSGSDNHGTLEQWRAAFPDATLTAFGFSLGSGVKGDGTLNSITLAGTPYTFAAPVVLTPTTVAIIHPAGSSSVRVQIHTDPAGAGPVTGFVDINDSSTGDTVQKCELTSTTGQVTVPASCLPPGTYNLTAVYEGNDTFAGSSSAPKDVTISQPTARVIETVNRSKTPSVKAVVKRPTGGYGNFPTPRGLASFYATDPSGGGYQNLCTDQELDSTGSTTCSLSGLANGSYLIYAVYGGETYYNGNTSSGVAFTRKGAPALAG